MVNVTDGCEGGGQSCQICNTSQTGPPHNSGDPVCLVILLAQSSIFSKEEDDETENKPYVGTEYE